MKHSRLKKILLPLVLLAALAVLAGCTAQSPTATEVPTAEPTAGADAAFTSADTETTEAPTAEPTATATLESVTLPVFDAEELAKYDGQNGNPAYVAVDGKVYDVSDVSEWKDGSHFGKFQAGQDLTEEIKTLSPHGVSKLDSVPIVGLYEP